MPLILWFKNHDLLIVGLALTAYYAGFTLSTYYGQWSSATLSRTAGTFLTAHVITTILLAAYGYGYMTLVFSLLVGATTGGLLSLPSSKVMSLPIASLLSIFPFLGAILIETYGIDYVLISSGMLAFASSIILLISLKIIVPKPKIEERIKSGLSLDGWILALGIGLGGGMGTILIPLIAVIALDLNVLYVGAIITASLIAIQVIAWRLRNQKVIYKGMGNIMVLSLIFAFLVMGIVENLLIFLAMWFLVTIDLSYYNSFLVVANRTLKKFDEYKFMLLSSSFSALGPILAILIWAMGSYQAIFYFSALLILLGWISVRMLFKEVK
ncbi:MAG: hypothetical protein ACUVQ5_05350 [Candidatus Methanomethylicaceae archaeon]